MNIMCGAAAVGIGDLGRRGDQAVFQFSVSAPREDLMAIMHKERVFALQ